MGIRSVGADCNRWTIVPAQHNARHHGRTETRRLLGRSDQEPRPSSPAGTGKPVSQGPRCLLPSSSTRHSPAFSTIWAACSKASSQRIRFNGWLLMTPRVGTSLFKFCVRFRCFGSGITSSPSRAFRQARLQPGPLLNKETCWVSSKPHAEPRRSSC